MLLLVWFLLRGQRWGVPCRKAVCGESLSRAWDFRGVATYSSGGSWLSVRDAQFVGLSGFTVRVETVE
jgi:hypothetical protein